MECIIMIDFVNDDIHDIAQSLLGMILVHEVDGIKRSGIIVDTEIYMGEVDAASHAYQGKRTRRMEAMFQLGGSLYTYTMRGHVLLNLVCGKKDEGIGVMIRAIKPLDGLDAMIAARNQTGPNISNGPAKLTQALGITMDLYGSHLGEYLHLVQNTPYHPKNICATSRIGIPDKGEWTHAPLRFYVKGNPYCSNIPRKDWDDDHGWQ